MFLLNTVNRFYRTFYRSFSLIVFVSQSSAIISSHSAAERDRTRAGQSSVIEHEVLLLQVVECCDGSSSIQYQVDKMFSSASNVKQNKTTSHYSLSLLSLSSSLSA